METDREEGIQLPVSWRTGGFADWTIDGEEYLERREIFHFFGDPGIKLIEFEPNRDYRVRRIIWPEWNFLGEIDEGFGDLDNFIHLDLSKNKFEDNLTSEEVEGLEDMINLHLDYNFFEGEIPEELGNLIDLEELSLHDNFFEGEIPEELEDLEDLEKLYLHNNRLEEFPNEDFFTNFPELELLTLRNNFFQNIPSSIFSLRRVSTIHLRNNITDDLFDISDPSVFEEAESLEHLRADQNVLGCLGEGAEIPPEIEDIESMEELRDYHDKKDWHPRQLFIDLRYNCIEEIPEEMGELTALNFIKLDNNAIEEFGGSSFGIPEEISELEDPDNPVGFLLLSVYNNKLEGEIHEDIGQLDQLQTFRAQNNRLEGEIPEELLEIPELRILNLENNYYDGSGLGMPADGAASPLLDKFFAARNEITHLNDFSAPEIRFLHLEENEINELPDQFGNNFGNSLLKLTLWKNEDITELPDSFSNLGDELFFLDIAMMNLNDFPEELSDLTGLEYLNISRQTGDVSMTRFNMDGLMSGPVDEEITDLTQLITFIISNNELSQLPENGWGGMQLAYLYAQNNELTNLPPEMGDLSELERLYLNNNQIEVSIDDNLTNTSELERFYIQYNNEDKADKSSGGVSGNLPENNSWNQLERFLADSNEIDGGLHTGFVQNLEEIEILSLYRNLLDGEIDEEIGVMNELVWWDVGLSHERGEGDGLIGGIPDTVGNLGELKVFDFNNNQITEVPDEINQNTNLISLLGFENCVEGFVENVGNMQNLRHMDFHNAIVGNYVQNWPENVESLTDLIYLSFGENKSVSGEVNWGEWSGNLPSDMLFLNNNNLDSSDFNEVNLSEVNDMASFNVRGNNFGGSFPTN